MFKKTVKPEGDVPFDEVETIIGPSVKIEGEFQSSGNVMVAGVFIGKLITTQNVRIEASAQIQGDITAREAIIAGTVQGNLTVAEHLSLLSSAKITGDITAGSIAVLQGAQMNGKCAMVSGPRAPIPPSGQSSALHEVAEIL